ncbi:MAG: cpaB, partial [Clostridiales bacterium]|nr:cpaB [Clostridiales bacterium]
KIIEGEQVLKDRIVGEEKTLLSYSIPQGKRAVTVNVNEAAEVADFIRPGDYVDIIVTSDKYEYEDGKARTIYAKTTKIILQNILILGMGQLQDIPEKARQAFPKTVTLAVSPDEAEKLVYGEETGVMRMALRRIGEHDITETKGIIREDISSEKGKWVIPK